MKESSKSRLHGLLMVAMSAGIVGAVWVRTGQYREEIDARQAEIERQLDQDLQHLFEVQLRSIERTKVSAAIQVDLDGNVTWMNDNAARNFPLLRVGSTIEVIMKAGEAVHHRKSFLAAMDRHQSNQRGAMTSLDCTARTSKGWQQIHIETWSTPAGGMGFLDIIESD